MANIAEELLMLTQMVWDENRIAQFREFRDLYENDFDDIVKALKKYYTNKPFSKGSLERRNFQHHDIIQRILTRQNAGIYDKEPNRELIINDKGETDPYLSDVLLYLNYNEKMKESLRKARFFNIIELQVAFRDSGIDLDIYSPDYYSVRTGRDYLKAVSYLIQKVDQNGLFYYTYWDKDKYYYTDGFGNQIKEKNNPDYKNKYGFLPFNTFRMREMSDYFGEPAWGLFLSQLAIDMVLTDKDYSEFLNRNPILFGVNTSIPDNQVIGAGTLIQKDHREPNTPQPSLEYLNSGFDINQTQDSIEWRIQSQLRNENIVGASAQLDTTATSGASKEKDEQGLQEERDSVLNNLYRFEIKNLNLIRKVWNFHVNQGDIKPNDFLSEIKKLPEGKFDVEFRCDEKEMSVDEKIKLRQYEKENYLKDEIDIVMEELGIGEKEAKAQIQKIKGRMAEFGKTQLQKPAQTLREKLLGNANG